MRRKSPKWINDISVSAEFIIKETDGKELDEYKSNPLLRAAVERHFEIIGEAVNRLVNHDPETAAGIANYPQIIAFRNMLIHGYDLVHEQVWKVVKEYLPLLKAESAKLLEENDSSVR